MTPKLLVALVVVVYNDLFIYCRHRNVKRKMFCQRFWQVSVTARPMMHVIMLCWIDLRSSTKDLQAEKEV